MKSKLAIVLVFALLALAACSSANPAGTPAPSAAPSPTPSATAAPTPAEDAVICTVNGTSIMRSAYGPVFSMTMNYQMQYTQSVTAEQLKQIQDAVFTQLVQSEVIYQKAVEQNITLTDEEKAALQKEADEQYNAQLTSYEQLAQKEGAADVKARAAQMLLEDLVPFGLTSVESYRALLVNDRIKAAMAVKLKDDVCKDVTYTEEEAVADFPLDLQVQREQIRKAPLTFETFLSQFEAGNGVPPLFIPEGYIRVRHILVDTMETANDIKKRLDAGESFDTLLEQYNTDPGMKQEPAKTNGYALSKDSSFIQEFKDAAFKLENVGDISEPVKSEFGYHVLRLEAKLTPGSLTLDQVKDEYITGKLAQRKTEYFNKQIGEWIKAANIVSYIGRIRDMGQGAVQ